MQAQTPDNPQITIVIPLFDLVVYPGSRAKFQVDRVTGEGLVTAMQDGGALQAVGLAVRNGKTPEDLDAGALYSTGVLLRVIQIQPSEDGYVVAAEAGPRMLAVSVDGEDGRFSAACVPVPDVDDLPADERGRALEEVRSAVHRVSARFSGAEQFTRPIDSMESVDQIMGFVMPFMPVEIEAKQAFLEYTSVRERYGAFLELIVKMNEQIALRIEMAQKVSERMGRMNREAMLREQLRVILEELGEGSGDENDDGDYRQRIEESKMPDEVRRKALADLRKLETGGGQNHEAGILRSYLDLLLDLPWVTEERKEIDIAGARRVLESHHNGLEKVKERIVQHLAVMKLKGEKQGSILLFSGPPGTGKTSLGKSVAEALGRKYVRISLGGIRDEAEIRGHRRTYVGALPGRIVQGIRRAGTRNPVFVLDEIDKLAVGYQGDPASALLEVLDPEQNAAFSDHYLEVPFDLSDVLFIATANSLQSIPAPLLDRMELIEISGYTGKEKFAIARDHLVPEVLREHGLDAERLRFDDDALRAIVDRYTREAGVRQLKQQLAKAARHVSERVVSGAVELPFVVTVGKLPEVLGKEPVRVEVARKDPVPGVATGLAWTPVGGEILFIEVSIMPGTGKLTLTGQLGDVMKESATISLSLIRSRLADPRSGFDFTKCDTHIHVPSGATPKDGPSAGVTLFTALASLVTGRTVDSGLAMTGEVTLSGAVMPVGGIREKVLAAHRAGCTRVILPKENERDLLDVPEEVRAELRFVTVETVEEVLREALGIDLPRSVVLHAGGAVHLLPAPPGIPQQA
ncbi:MAG: endopeptidase La [Methanospirillum sp.]|nr:endopeptidase La [Methanospirillum sp.]